MPSNCDPTFKNYLCMLTYINCTKVVYFTWWFHYGVFYMYITHFGYQPHPHDPHLPHFHCCSLYSLQVLLWFSCLSKKIHIWGKHAMPVWVWLISLKMISVLRQKRICRIFCSSFVTDRVHLTGWDYGGYLAMENYKLYCPVCECSV